MCLAQPHNTVTPVWLKPATPQSLDKHSTTEPLRSLKPLLFKTDKSRKNEPTHEISVIALYISQGSDQLTHL